MQSHQMAGHPQHQHTLNTMVGLGLDNGAGSYSYALKQQQQSMMPMLGSMGNSPSWTDPKLLGMGISPYLTPPVCYLHSFPSPHLVGCEGSHI